MPGITTKPHATGLSARSTTSGGSLAWPAAVCVPMAAGKPGKEAWEK